MIENFRHQRPPENYFTEEIPSPRFGLPTVTKHDPSTDKGWGSFMGALTEFVSASPVDNSPLGVAGFLDKVKQDGIFVNQLRAYWEDLHRVDKPKRLTEGLTKEEYIAKNATLENSNIGEYSWKTEGRFAIIPKEDDYFRCVFSRQERIFSKDPKRSREKLEKLRRGKIKIGGLGVGGVAGYLLVLTGAQNIDVADPGVLPPHKLNRFIGGDASLLGQPYVDVWGRAVLDLNPYLNLGLNYKKLGYEDEGDDTISMRKFMQGGDVMVEEVDSFPMKNEAGEVAEEFGIPLVMASDVGNTSVLEVKMPGIRRWDGISDGERRRIIQSPKSFPEATELANAIIGREYIPDDLLTQAANLGYDFWPQDAGAAFLSAKAIRDAIIAILSEEEIWERTVFENKKVR